MRPYTALFNSLLFIFILALVPSKVVNAQTTRDHRTKKKSQTSKPSLTKGTSRKNAAIVAKANTKEQILFFDEADALFGKRTNVAASSVSVRFTKELETIHLAKKPGSGSKLTYKMPSGNILHANVENGKILNLNLKGSNRAMIKSYPILETPRTGYSARKASGCLNCKRVCVETYNDLGHPVGSPDCKFVCTPVKCGSKDQNGILTGNKAKQ